MAKRMTEDEEAVLAEASELDASIDQPPGEPVMVTIRPLTRDDGNIAGVKVAAPRNRINVAQHEFAPLVRKLDDEEWRQLARGENGKNWRIIQQYEV